MSGIRVHLGHVYRFNLNNLSSVLMLSRMSPDIVVESFHRGVAQIKGIDRKSFVPFALLC